MLEAAQQRLARLATLFCLLSVFAAGAVCSPSSAYALAKGQTVYVPVYANVFTAPKAIPFSLATILSIRNTDLVHPITIVTADYYDTKGKLLKRYYPKPIVLAPLESTYLYISEQEASGGVGANFIVKWSADREVNVPIIESVMIGAKSGQGISFVSPGQVLEESGK